MTKIFKNFLLLLIKKRRIFFIEKILASFNKFVQKKRRNTSFSNFIKRVKINYKILVKKCQKIIGSTEIFQFFQDDNLIGGIKLQVGSLMIDSSIKNKLKKYKQLMDI